MRALRLYTTQLNAKRNLCIWEQRTQTDAHGRWTGMYAWYVSITHGHHVNTRESISVAPSRQRIISSFTTVVAAVHCKSPICLTSLSPAISRPGTCQPPSFLQPLRAGFFTTLINAMFVCASAARIYQRLRQISSVKQLYRRRCMVQRLRIWVYEQLCVYNSCICLRCTHAPFSASILTTDKSGRSFDVLSAVCQCLLMFFYIHLLVAKRCCVLLLSLK